MTLKVLPFFGIQKGFGKRIVFYLQSSDLCEGLGRYHFNSDKTSGAQLHSEKTNRPPHSGTL